MQKLTLIKLGGSIITEKSQPETLRPSVLQRLVSEVAAAQKETGELFIIGHGQGSFAHVPAKKYQTKQGFINSESKLGMGLTQDSALRCNRHVVDAFLSQNLPAVSYLLSSALVTKNKVAEHWQPSVLETLLANGMIPITCGDVLTDSEIGCTIWSTETILSFLAAYFYTHPNYTVTRIFHVTDVDGVLDEKNHVIPLITASSYPQVKQYLTAPTSADVTGGMRHKIEESLAQAEEGIAVSILSGLVPGRLELALTGKEYLGTIIRSEV